VECGLNELVEKGKVSAWKILLEQFKNFLIIILLVAVVLSAIMGEVADAIVIFVIVLFAAGLGFIQEYRAERAMEALKKMLSPTITALRGGKEEEVPSKELVPGDILLLEAGDKIPADARLVENHSLRCDEAPLTGESVPVGKDIKPLSENVRVSDRKNMIFTGTIVTYGRGKAVVTSTGMTTEFGKIAEEVTAVETEKTPLEKRTEEMAKIKAGKAAARLIEQEGGKAEKPKKEKAPKPKKEEKKEEKPKRKIRFKIGGGKEKEVKEREKIIGAQLSLALGKSKLADRAIGKCPTCNSGQLVILRSRKTGKRFVGCSNYFQGKCNTAFPLPQTGTVKPLNITCRNCGSPVMAVYVMGRKARRFCLNPTNAPLNSSTLVKR
jgi:hypothetical protein